MRRRRMQFEALEKRHLLAALVASPEEVWSRASDAGPHRFPEQSHPVVRALDYQVFSLDDASLRGRLTAASHRPDHPKFQPPVITVPDPEGRLHHFAVTESSVMAPELAAQFPQIKTYLGQSIKDASATLRLSLSPFGFHAQVLSPEGDFYIDPYQHLDTTRYASYFADGEFREHQHEFFEKVVGGHEELAKPSDTEGPSRELNRSGAQLRTYRLAVAATGEYTAFHGGTVAAGMAAIVNAVNRVSGLYEAELAIRLQLVGNNSSIVYTSANSDPYTNHDGVEMLGENQSNLNSAIGSTNFDIGHVFSTGGGGVAALNSVGVNAIKAMGVTGLSNPVGDSFYIDYVSHEMGHQFGANHTWNGDSGSCDAFQHQPTTAMEPGSGSTIMGYAGICGDDDIQFLSDPYFHSVSFDEILQHVDGNIPSVGTRTSTSNNVPNVDAGIDYTIPSHTPFTLTAVGSDADASDQLTYNWEQRDAGPRQDLDAGDTGNNPLFRSRLPTTNPSRTFPSASSIISGVSAAGETLPTTTRTMNFRATVRDNRSGGGGVNTDDMAVHVVNTGAPFRVTSPNSFVAYPASSTQTVSWNVAGTTANGINTAAVNIRLSLDGGTTFPLTLASGVPNDGSHDVVMPTLTTQTARILIEGAGNIFFDISDTNFVIGSVPASIVEDFDSVVAPNLPSGWSTTPSGAGVAWTTQGFPSHSAPNHAFVPNPDETGESVLVSPAFIGPQQISFHHRYNIENTYDGGVLEISIAGAPFVDIEAAGGQFLAGGYDGKVSSQYSNPLANRNAWTGDSAGYIESNVQLPANAVGQNVQLRWRLGTDEIVGAEGWQIDSIESISVEYDFGDAPDPGYATLVSSDGARHVVGAALYLGSQIEAESDGIPGTDAQGDDLDGVDDEDGVALPASLVPGTNASLMITASQSGGVLNAWLDFNDDGDWSDPGEQIFVNQPLNAGANQFSMTVPASAVPTPQTYARFRLSTQHDVSFNGAADDGEVEDYAIEIGAAPVSSGLELSFTPATISEADGTGAATATLTRTDDDLSQSMVVSLVSSDPSEISVPAQVTIPAGSPSVTFPVDAVDDAFADGTQTVTVTATEVSSGEFAHDLSFGDSGEVLTAMRQNLQTNNPEVVVQPDGKVLAAGRHPTLDDTWQLVRLNENGTYDSGFGASGTASTTFAGMSSIRPTEIILHPNGKITLIGLGSGGNPVPWILARYNANGSPDSTFGINGVAKLPPPLAASYVKNGVLNADGSMYLVGGQGVGDLVIAKLNSNGTLDTSFGSGGAFVPPLVPDATDNQLDIIAHPDGGYAVTGMSITSSNAERFYVAKFTADGTVDTTFGTDGYQIANFGFLRQRPRAIAVQPDGKIVVAGYVEPSNSNNSSWALVRFNLDGSLDPSFGVSGLVTANLTNSSDEAEDMIVLPDGRIVVVGSVLVSGQGDQRAIAVFTHNGARDTSFANNGLYVGPSLPELWEVTRDVALAPDGKIVTFSGYFENYLIERFLLPPVETTSASIDVLDDDPRSVTFTFAAPAISETAGVAAAEATVTRNDEDLSEPLTVLLTNDDPTELSVPPQVTIPAGQFSVTFPVDAIDDAVFDGTQTVTVTPTAVQIAPTLDASFGDGDGRIDSPGEGTPLIAMRPDGSVLVVSYDSAAGMQRVTRYQTNGSIDSDWGDSGSVLLDLLFNPNAITVQSDGKILIGGTDAVGVDRDLGFARLVEDGSFDPTFGTAGQILMTDPSRSDELNQLALQSDGKIVAVGSYQNNFGVLRLNPDGSVDTTFASSGWWVQDLGRADAATDLTVKADDSLVIVGYEGGGNFDSRIVMLSLVADGLPDTAFGTAGLVKTDLAGEYDMGRGVTLTSAGQILVTGKSAEVDEFPAVDDLVVIRYESDGSIDATFGDTGVASVPTVGIGEAGERVAVTSSGLIVAAGLMDGLAGFQLFSAEGDFLGQAGLPAPDRTFGGLAIQPSGQVLVSGDFTPGFVARYHLVVDDPTHSSIAGSIEVLDNEPEPLNEIRGTKWLDADFDGLRDGSEPGLAGWTIFLDLDGNGQWDSGEPSTLTASDDPSTDIDETGTYVFEDLVAGEYRVGEVQQTGWQQSHPATLGSGIERASVADDGSELNGIGALPSLSFDGRFVSFTSDATNVHAGIANAFGDVFVNDRLLNRVERVSVSNTGEEGNGHSTLSSISGDGRFVVFQSGASNLVADDTNAVEDLFLVDRGATTNRLRMITRASDGSSANGASENPRISHDGRYVVFESAASNLVAQDTNGEADVFLYDAVTDQIELISVGMTNLSGGGTSRQASVSGDGRFVAFGSDAPDLVVGDTNAVNDVFVRDRLTGTTKRISMTRTGTEIPGPASAFAPMISGDGNSVVFASTSNQISPDDTNNFVDIFVYDDTTGITSLVTRGFDGQQANLASWDPVISYDGQQIAYYSFASNLVADDTNGAPDVFWFDVASATTRRVNLTHNGLQSATGVTPWVPAISGDGSAVGFFSEASDLVLDDNNAGFDVFVATMAGSGDGFHSISLSGGTVMVGMDFANTPIPSLSFDVSSSTSSEAVGTHSIDVVLTLPTGVTLSAPLSVEVIDMGSGSATAGSDYVDVAQTLTFAAGAGNGDRQTATISWIADDLVEPDETLVLGLAQPSLFATLGEIATHEVTLEQPATIVGRYIFYNNSAFDGNGVAIDTDPVGGFADFDAIATDKSALLPGESASFANYTSYSRGINGIIIDIANAREEITAGDFEFRVGNDSNPSNWASAPEPTSLNLLAGTGVGGSDRVVISFSDVAISKKWLQIRVIASVTTGLTFDDIHYWGNWVGESGNSAFDTSVNSTDAFLVLNNSTSSSTAANIANNWDFTRDGAVNSTDAFLALSNATSSGNYLRLISPPPETNAAEAKSTAEHSMTPSSVDRFLSDKKNTDALLRSCHLHPPVLDQFE